MEQIKDLMVEETVNEVSDEVVSAYAARANAASRSVSKVAVVLGGVGALLGVRALYKKVIKPKLDAHKAKKAAKKAAEAYAEAITGEPCDEPEANI